MWGRDSLGTASVRRPTKGRLFTPVVRTRRTASRSHQTLCGRTGPRVIDPLEQLSVYPGGTEDETELPRFAITKPYIINGLLHLHPLCLEMSLDIGSN